MQGRESHLHHQNKGFNFIAPEIQVIEKGWGDLRSRGSGELPHVFGT